MRRTLIENADWIITMTETRDRIRHGDIVYEDNVIREVGTDLRGRYDRFDEIIDAAGMIVTPGFINTHHHTWQSLIRNIKATQGLTLEPWLTVMYEIYKDLWSEVATAGVYASLGDCMKSGCTTSNDLWYPHPVGEHDLMDAEIKAAAELGIRFHPVRSYHSVVSDIVPKEVVDTIDGVMSDAQRLVDTYHDRSEYSMCRVGIGPSIAQYETEEILKATVDFAESNDIMVHGHLAESHHETEFTYDKFGCSPVKWFYKHNLLGERFYYAHCIHLDDEDIRIMSDTKTGVSSCPVSNKNIRSGACTIKDLKKAAVKRIRQGVDEHAISNSSNIMEEMRVSYLLNRLAYGDRPCSAEDIFYMVTAGGAKVLGRDDIGTLAPDKAADITILNWKQLSYAGGCNDPVDSIVISGDARMVDTVICNGIKVVEKHKLTRVNEAEKRDYTNKIGKELLTKASSRIPRLKADIE